MRTLKEERKGSAKGEDFRSTEKKGISQGWSCSILQKTKSEHGAASQTQVASVELETRRLGEGKEDNGETEIS